MQDVQPNSSRPLNLGRVIRRSVKRERQRFFFFFPGVINSCLLRVNLKSVQLSRMLSKTCKCHSNWSFKVQCSLQKSHQMMLLIHHAFGFLSNVTEEWLLLKDCCAFLLPFVFFSFTVGARLITSRCFATFSFFVWKGGETNKQSIIPTQSVQNCFKMRKLINLTDKPIHFIFFFPDFIYARTSSIAFLCVFRLSAFACNSPISACFPSIQSPSPNAWHA